MQFFAPDYALVAKQYNKIQKTGDAAALERFVEKRKRIVKDIARVSPESSYANAGLMVLLS